jgi:Peptidase family S41
MNINNRFTIEHSQVFRRRSTNSLRMLSAEQNASITRTVRCIALCGALVLPAATISWAPAAGATISRAVAAGAAAQLEAAYVFPERGHRAADVVRANAAAGMYDALEGKALAVQLTVDLGSVLHDKHVRLNYVDGTLPQAVPVGPGGVTSTRQMRYGLARIARLRGNIGYLDLRGFARDNAATERALDAAVEALASSDAIVLDLRRNGGGDPDSVARLLSHVLPPGTRLNDFIARDGSVQKSTFTVALPTPTIHVPMYALTSAQTFSGGEECAYDLKALKRATLVGEVTGGGANPGGTHRIDEHFSIFVPDARPRNAVTQTNWEGVGVEPDVAVPADGALKTAYAAALGVKRAEPAVAVQLGSMADEQILTGFGVAITVLPDFKIVPIAPALLVEYAGVYQMTADVAMVITVEGDHLGSRAGTQGDVSLYPESEARFFSMQFESEIEFIRDPVTHAVTQLVVHQNGRDSTGTRLP